MLKMKVLFVCIHNSARSQMAEALLKKIAGDKFDAESAGLEPGVLNPLAISAMKDIGVDISQNKTKSVFDFFKQGKKYHYVITVCEESKAQKCPVFPGIKSQLHWNFEDPSGFTGTYAEKLEKTRKVRDNINNKIKEWVRSLEEKS